jgi:hypothetical protein
MVAVWCPNNDDNLGGCSTPGVWSVAWLCFKSHVSLECACTRGGALTQWANAG